MERGSSFSPSEQVARLYEEAEAQAAKAGERLVGTRGFAALLGQMAENAAALTKLSTDAMDLVIRNLRVAGRRDVVRLARQLARTEDKLELVLQELEEVRDQLARQDVESERESGGKRARERTGRSPPSNGSTARGRKTAS